MEIINIKTLEKKGNMLIVGYTLKSLVGMPVNDATMNEGWQSQEINFLMNDVGVGGSFEGEIVEKPNKNNPNKPYWNVTKVNMDSNFNTNITKVDMDNAKKGDTNIQKPLMSQRDSSIVAQVCLKGAVELAKGKEVSLCNTNEELGAFLCMAVNELVGAYKVAIKALE